MSTMSHGKILLTFAVLLIFIVAIDGARRTNAKDRAVPAKTTKAPAKDKATTATKAPARAKKNGEDDDVLGADELKIMQSSLGDEKFEVNSLHKVQGYFLLQLFCPTKAYVARVEFLKGTATTDGQEWEDNGFNVTCRSFGGSKAVNEVG